MSRILQLAQAEGLVPQAPLVSFNEEDITLTEKEKEDILAKALREKRAIEARRAYNERILQSNVFPQLDSAKFFRLIMAKAKAEIQDFSMTNDHERIYRLLAQYFTSDEQFELNGYSLRKGILLSGSVGCGKTTMMRMFNLNPLASYVIRSCRKIASEFTEKDKGENILYQYAGKYFPFNIDNPFKCDSWGICFDDLGTEDLKKHMGNEKTNVMQHILLNRYDNAKEIPNRTHITTNMSADQIEEFYGERVRSRMREMFNIIEVSGGDLRR